jgi:lipopolysaccharide transport system ATP-binding protein
MSDIAIRVENLSKKYSIGETIRQDTLRDALVHNLWPRIARMARRNGDSPHSSNPRQNSHSSNETEFWALKDVSFEVKRGEVVGVIGRNGAGKSTLLKVLSRITEPTSGVAEIHGRVGSLLEVGTGFHPELTGRENIYLNGAILGMKRVEIDRKFDEIVAFAEIEKFLDTPVKRYSSGMYVRLAFAVAAHLEPEILLVDEVLSVGDLSFQRKCLGKMGAVARAGRTVLFVSHNMAAIAEFCDRAVLLEKGRVEFIGGTKHGVRLYLSRNAPHEAERRWPRDDAALSNGPIRFDYIRLTNATGEVVSEIANTEESCIEIGYRILDDIQDLYVGLQLVTSDGIIVLDSHDQDSRNLFPNGRKSGAYVGRCKLPAFLLNEGGYTLNLVSYIPRHRVFVHEEGILAFQVVYAGGVGPTPRKPGIIRPALDWSVSYMPEVQ